MKDDVREYQGKFYKLEDFDANGRPYSDAKPFDEKSNNVKVVCKQDLQTEIEFDDDIYYTFLKNNTITFTTEGKYSVDYYDSYGFKIK